MRSIFLVLGLFFSTIAFARPIPTDAEIVAQALRNQDAPSEGFNGSLNFDFSGQANLDNCSGSVVSFGQSGEAKAILLTNGHCIGMMEGDPNAIISNQPYPRSISLYVTQNQSVPARITRVIYGLIQPHDIAFLELNQSYDELAAKGVKSRKISDKMADVKTSIALASGYANTVKTCEIEAIIHEIHEGGWVNLKSYKYHCNAHPGTSGSPLVDLDTGEVIGVNYTGNDDGERCTVNNPCEVDEQGKVTVEQGADYGDQVCKIMGCLDADRAIDLTVPGCLLPRSAN